MALTTFTNNNPLDADDLNTNFTVVSGIRGPTQYGFNNPLLLPGGNSTSRFAAGDIFFKIKLAASSGQDITRVAANFSYRLNYSTQPTIKIQYSTNDSTWTDLATGTTLAATGELGHVYGAKTDFADLEVWIRLVGESQSFDAELSNVNIQYTTDTQEEHSLQGMNISPILKSTSAVSRVLDSNNGDTQTTNGWFPVAIIAPYGKTIESISTYGYITVVTVSTSTTATTELKYSTNGSTWNSFTDGNSEASTGSASTQYTHPHWGFVEGLSSAVAYVSFELQKGASVYSIDITNGMTWVFATFA